MSDSPRTDAILDRYGSGLHGQTYLQQMIDHARTLERELHQERQRRMAAEKDAERYRWLREPGELKHRESFVHRTCYVCQNSGAELDAAIDNAIAESGGKG